MNSKLACPECGHVAESPESVLGRRVRCPSCRAVFRATVSELKLAAGPRSDEYSLEPAAPSRPYPERRPTVLPPATVSPRVAQSEARTSSKQQAPTVASVQAKTFPDQPNRLLIKRGKKATALIVTHPSADSRGTAFCLDRSGLFVANAHVVKTVVEKTALPTGYFGLLVDLGLGSQRPVGARVLRTDDYFDLALLKTDADPRLATLELGDDRTLSETAPVFTIGYPFGPFPRLGYENYPSCTVISSKITVLHGPKDR